MFLVLLGGGALIGSAVTGGLELLLGVGSSLVSATKAAENQRLANQALAETMPVAALVPIMRLIDPPDPDLVRVEQELRIATAAGEFRRVVVGSPLTKGGPPVTLLMTSSEDMLLARYLGMGQRGGREDWDAPLVRTLLKLIESEQETRELVAV